MQETGIALLGARRLAYTCMGAGSPAVVLESAGGAARDSWNQVMPAIAAFTRVVSYDRAGLGQSQPGERRRSLPELTGDLRAVLAASAAPGPFILVGHSIGGHIVREYARRYPEEVAGLVLIDSSHPDAGQRTLALLPPPTPQDSDFIQSMRVGLAQGGYVDDPEHDPEGIDFAACDDQARALGWLGDLPLVVIAAANHQKDAGDPLYDPALCPPSLAAAIEQMHLGLQANLARLSTRGRLVLAQESGHFVQRDQPDLVTGVIREMVQAYRAG